MDENNGTIEKARHLLGKTSPAPWEWLGRNGRMEGKLISVPSKSGWLYDTVAGADTYMDREPQPFVTVDKLADALAIALAPDLIDTVVRQADHLQRVIVALQAEADAHNPGYKSAIAYALKLLTETPTDDR